MNKRIGLENESDLDLIIDSIIMGKGYKIKKSFLQKLGKRHDDSKKRFFSFVSTDKDNKGKGLDQSALKSIFSFLNVIEMVTISRVCSTWKKIIEKNPDILLSLNLSILPQKINSLNFIKILGRAQMLKQIILPQTMAVTDTLSFLMMAPQSLISLTITNINIDFATVLGSLTLPNVENLDLTNLVNRKKNFNSNEIKAVSKAFPKLKVLILDAAPVDDEGLELFFSKVKSLESLSLLKCSSLTNNVFMNIAINCQQLKKLAIGGSPTNYNLNFTYEGIEILCGIHSDLESIRFEYCSRLGEKCLLKIIERFGQSLKELHVIRNCFEKCSKITDNVISKFGSCPSLERLSFIYVRSFGDLFHIYLGKFLSRLKVLNLRECPIQEDLSLLNEGCPDLEEVDLSGDSWVKCETVIGLSKHKKLKILKLGHVEHAEGHCDKGLGEFPPKGMSIKSIFEKKDSFINLKKLYLEQICGLTYWLDFRIKELRPELEIKYTLYDKTLNFDQLSEV